MVPVPDGIDVNDGLLAVSAAMSGGRLVTQDVRHYPMPEAVVDKGW